MSFRLHRGVRGLALLNDKAIERSYSLCNHLLPSFKIYIAYQEAQSLRCTLHHKLYAGCENSVISGPATVVKGYEPNKTTWSNYGIHSIVAHNLACQRVGGDVHFVTRITIYKEKLAVERKRTESMKRRVNEGDKVCPCPLLVCVDYYVRKKIPGRKNTNWHGLQILGWQAGTAAGQERMPR